MQPSRSPPLCLWPSLPAELQVVHARCDSLAACEQTIMYFTLDEHLGKFWYFCQLMTRTARNSSLSFGAHVYTFLLGVYAKKEEIEVAGSEGGHVLGFRRCSQTLLPSSCASLPPTETSTS